MDNQEGNDSRLPIDFNGSLDPSQLPNVTLGDESIMASQTPHSAIKLYPQFNGGGRRSPVKTIKEYDQQVSDLVKENFNLKLRIYHMEDRMDQYGDRQEVIKTNIELKVENDRLKEDLNEKQIFLHKAAQAISTMTTNHQEEQEAIRKQSQEDRQKEMAAVGKELEKAVLECKLSKEKAKEATRELEKAEEGLRLAHTYNEELSQKLEAALRDVEAVGEKLKDSESETDALRDNLSDLQKQLDRKDRDFKRLSVCLDGKSLVESASLLEPQYLQDKYEDKVEEVYKLKGKISDLDAEIMLKDDKLKENQKELSEKTKELDDKATDAANLKSTINAMMNKLYKLNKASQEKDGKLKEMETKLADLEKSLAQAGKEKKQILNESMAARENNDHLVHHLDEVKHMAEGMVQSLAKKDGEMCDFQEQLKKALEALTCSETAVEELQLQLKRERAEFENRIKNQAQLFELNSSGSQSEDNLLKGQLMDLKKTTADQSVIILNQERQISDLLAQNRKLKLREEELMDHKESQDRKLSLLEREIQNLRLELERKDMRIGNLQQNSIHIEAPHGQEGNQKLDVNVQVLPNNVMGDLQALVDNLRQELLAIKVLKDSIHSLQQSRGATSPPGHVQSEVEAIEKIYHHLEDGVARNNQLHQSLLNTLRGSHTVMANGITSRSESSKSSPLRQDEVDGGRHSISPLIDLSRTSPKLGNVSLHMSQLSIAANPDVISPSRQSVRPSIQPSELVEELEDVSITESLSDHSLTDDAKETHGKHMDSVDFTLLPHFFEPRMQDRASSLYHRVNSQEDNGKSLASTGSCQMLVPAAPATNMIDLSPSSIGDSNVVNRSHDQNNEKRMNNGSTQEINSGVVENSVDPNVRFSTQRGNWMDNLSQSKNRSAEGKAAMVREEGRDSLPNKNGSSVELMLFDETDDGCALVTSTTDVRDQNNSGKLWSTLEDFSIARHDPVDSHEDMARLQAKLTETIQQKEEGLSQIKQLEDKLEATENTVRQLSRRMKSCQIALEQAGIDNPPINSRSNSEDSIGTNCGQIRRRPSVLSDDGHGSTERSLVPHSDRASMEKERAGHPSPGLSHFSAMSPGTLVISPSSPSHTKMSLRSQTVGSELTSLDSPPRLSYPHTVSESDSNQDSDHSPPKEAIHSSSTGVSTFNTSHRETHNVEELAGVSQLSFVDATLMEVPDGTDGVRTQDDPTMTSLLVTDSTFLHKFPFNLDQTTLRPQQEESFNNATMNVEKLHSRLNYLEQLIEMQKNEISVYEKLLSSLGFSVPQATDLKGGTCASDDSTNDDDLLRRSLFEIRKLRHRLENLESNNDADQILIFHTHSQQRIIRQEETISRLEQTLVEKESHWQREIIEKQHCFGREIALLKQKLDASQAETAIQLNRLEEQEKMIESLKENLELTETEQKLMVTETDTLRKENDELEAELSAEQKKVDTLEQEKMTFKEELMKCEEKIADLENDNELLKKKKEELDEDLARREADFLHTEQSLFSLEMMKEKLEEEKQRLADELVEREKQALKLRADADHFKESCRSLKEVQQEQMQRVKKLSQEKAEVSGKLAGLERELGDLRDEAERLQNEAAGKKKLEAEHSHLAGEFARLKMVADQNAVRQKEMEAEKVLLVTEMSKLRSEKEKVEADQSKRLQELSEEVETHKKESMTLEKEVQNLRGLGEEVTNLRRNLEKRRSLESELRARVLDLENSLKREEEEKSKIEEELRLRTEKVSKRERQCHHLIDRFGKLETAYKKQDKKLQEARESMDLTKKQLQLYETTVSTLSDKSHQNTMKELLEELALTKKMVADLLEQLEEKSKQVHKLKENLGIYESATISSSTTTITTESTSLTTKTTSVSNTNEVQFSPKTSLREPRLSSDKTGSGKEATPRGHDLHSLCAVLQLDQHEAASRQAGECLVSLSGLEARVTDRLHFYKAQSVTESLDYSTLREAGIACHQMRTCLDQVSKIISRAWITELPPVDTHGRFYDPDLAKETEKLKSELTDLQTKYTVLDKTVRDQQGKLSISKQRQRYWEDSVCRQLVRTSQDLEQAKENLDLSRGILQQVNVTANSRRRRCASDTGVAKSASTMGGGEPLTFNLPCKERGADEKE